MSRVIKRGKHSITLTAEEKVLYPKTNITKKDIIAYYDRIAPTMLPHITNRPLTMHRFVEGIHKEGFYHKDMPDYFPDWIASVSMKKKVDGAITYVLCNNQATLVYLANQLCITPHVWLSRYPKLEYPDRLIFDLDPAKGVPFATVAWCARQLKKLLTSFDLTPFLMTTGSRGLHVVVPLQTVHTFDEVRAFALSCAQQLEREFPNKVTTQMRKAKRGKRVFIDTLRNTWGQTAVAPYAVRALPGAPIATPLEWHELTSAPNQPQKYTIKNIFKRLARKDDPWHAIEREAQKLPNK